MMLVEADPVIAELVDFFPGVEMLGIGAGGGRRVEMCACQRVRQLGPDLQMVELLAIGQEIEDEDLHMRFPYRACLALALMAYLALAGRGMTSQES